MKLRSIALCLAMLTLACGSKPRKDNLWFSDKHAIGPDDTGLAPALSRSGAEKRLREALAKNDHRGVLLYANLLVNAGGALSSERARRARLSADAMSREALAKLWPRLRKKLAPAPMVALRLALLTRHAGELGPAVQWLGRVRGKGPMAKRARAIEKQLVAQRKVNPKIVAVLLPLTGRYRALGREARPAIQLAATTVGEVELRFLDTGGVAERAQAAVEKAVFELDAVAILGPLGMKESRAAASRAAELGVPMALLSSGGEAAPELGIFRLWSSPAWEAREAARIAVALGYDQLAVLAPRDEVGALQAAEFQRAATRARVKVVASGQYEPTGSNLQPDIKRFLGLDPKKNKRLRKHLLKWGTKRGWKTFSPEVKFELLYIPDVHTRAALVASYLPYFNVEVRSRDVIDTIRLKRKHGGRVPRVVQLLGGSGWHHLGIIPRGGAVMEGALVFDVTTGSDHEEYATATGAVFARAFKARTGHTPSTLASQAYDAASMVFIARTAATKQGSKKDVRAAFVRALAKTKLTEGACGPASIRRAGDVSRKATLLRIDSQQFVLHEY